MKWLTLILIALLWSCAGDEEEAQPTKPVFPEKTGYIMDTESVLSKEHEAYFTRKLDSLSTASGFELILHTTPDFQGGNIYEYGIALGNKWEVGHAGKGEGLFIVFSKARKQIRIFTGIGVEEVFTDSVCENIVKSKMGPYFQMEYYFDGFYHGINAIIAELNKSRSTEVEELP